jgi:hypothetical protein
MVRQILAFLVAIFMTHIFSSDKAYAQRAPLKSIAILIHLDLSHSMSNYHRRLSVLSDLVQKAAEQTTCEFRIGVTNIAYLDVETNDLRAFGTPAFITSSTPRGPEMLRQRIRDPYLFVPENREFYHRYVEKELTYTSVIEAVRQNREELLDVNFLASLLLTDAAPAFEAYSPTQALEEIQNLMPGVGFMATSISYDFSPYGSQLRCIPDLPEDPNRSDFDAQRQFTQINTSHWLSPHTESVNEFTINGHGWHWDICLTNYEAEIQQFLNMVLQQGGCSYLM